ncbi:MAG TPA: hemerythrin domain-containing protein, partial [Ferruginibacter sp.]|nr:hemerythrin domain-containing protein [Ferruginibacter sp.]
MLRYNIFNLIHKALRGKLYDTALAVQQTWFGDTADAASAFEKISEVIEAFEKHGYHEDTILMPFIEKFQSATIASFEKEHKDDKKMGNDLRQLQQIYLSVQTKEERIIAGSAITKAFVDYMIFNLQHMQREEIELNRLLWDHYSDDEIMLINKQIIDSIPADEMATSSLWFMQAINSEEARNWLIAVKQT